MATDPKYVECGKCHHFIQVEDQNAHAYDCYIVRLEAFELPHADDVKVQSEQLTLAT